MDIIVTNRFDDDLSVYLGNGDGTFQDQRRFGVGEDPIGIAVADVELDDDDDLIIANSTSGSVSVLFNTVFETPVEKNDFDGDGVEDDLDNCPRTGNPDQEDFDGDGTGDACDPDIDNDGIENGVDVCDFTPPGANIQPNGGLLSDVDGDCDVDLADFGLMMEEFTGPGRE